jgi:DNA-binding XRE family transcriptional regulator
MKRSVITPGHEHETPIGEAALTMAIGIIVERVGRLPLEDRRDLYELVKGLAQANDREELESIMTAMREILEQPAGGVKKMEFKHVGRRTEKLQRWVRHAAYRVEELRKEAGLTQSELAEKSGLPQSHISRIESAKLSPSRATLDKIAKALGIRISEIDPSA